MKNHLQKVKLFMQKANQETPDVPTPLPEKVAILRAKLIMEECLETLEAMGLSVSIHTDNRYVKSVDNISFEITHAQDIVKVADGLADLNVVVNGTAISYGLNMEPIQNLVDDSNLQKFRGDAYEDSNGKWIKPSDWQAPEIADEIGNQYINSIGSCGCGSQSRCCK